MKSRLIDHIGTNGPIPFDEFMEICLYDARDGFFASGSVRPGEHGDFITSPEVSPWFGRFVGRWAIHAAPSSDAILVEIGAGTGSLLEPLLGEVGDRFGQVFVVEVSQEARRAVAARLPAVTVVSSIAELPPDRSAVVVVNEVLDNLPSRLVERAEDGWIERRVGAVDESLVLVAVDADRDLAGWCDDMLADAPRGRTLAAQQRFEPWMRELGSTLGPFAACVVDYGAPTEKLADLRRGAVVRAYRSQRSGLDYLAHPGEVDITLDVNSDVLAVAATSVGADMTIESQRQFLADHGALEVLADLSRSAMEHAASGDVMAQLSARSDSVNVGALMDDSGLGGFSVFLLSRLFGQWPR